MSSPSLRWVVEEPLELSRLLSEQGGASALAEGRVFVDGKRVGSAPLLLARGACVEVYSARPPSQIEVLSDEGGVLAVRKPAELPTEPDRSGADCVLAQLARQLRLEPSALFAISRLDVGVSGVLLVTLGSRSRELLLAERQQGRLKRRYVAVAAATPQPGEGDWREALGGAHAGKRAVAGRDAKSAHTHYRVVASARPLAPGGQRTSLLALSPVTGRTHQLRAHAAAHAAPLLGDRKYGGPARLTAANGATWALSQILLHSAWVEWGEGPRRRRVTCSPSPELVETWLELGGESVDFQHALD